jgi:uncharacterized protein
MVGDGGRSISHLRFISILRVAPLGEPMLILQGGRDHQVTVADDLAIWQAAEYERPRHVDAQVVDDIAGWST